MATEPQPPDKIWLEYSYTTRHWIDRNPEDVYSREPVAYVRVQPEPTEPQERVEWPDTKAGDGRRLERYVLAVEYEVWEEAGISRQQLQETLFDELPIIVPDAKGDEGAELQQVEIARITTPSQHHTGGDSGVGSGAEGTADREQAVLGKDTGVASSIRQVEVGSGADQQREPGVDRLGNPTVGAASNTQHHTGDKLEITEEVVRWRMRAVAHAEAVKLLFHGKPPIPGTFGETWLRQAEETVRLDLGQEPFAAGLSALAKDKTIPAEAASSTTEKGEEA